jgi:DNA-binding NarL/FixJ family response regulator
MPELGVDAALAAAELTRLRGRPAPPRWAAVAAGFDDLRQPHAAAYARWRQAEALVDLGAPGRATAPLRAARDAAAALGARPLLREVASLAARERLDLDPAADGSPGRARDPFGLTPREREVLTHLVEGRTNRQIARALVVTEKTVGAYVSAILSKLGVANRGEAADLARRSGLPPATPLAG